MPALESRQPVEIEVPIRNTESHRGGAMLSGEIAKRFGHRGLRHDTIKVPPSRARPANPSARSWRGGVTFELIGDGNDYVGKGLSGGRIVIRPIRGIADRAGRFDYRRQYGALRGDRG